VRADEPFLLDRDVLGLDPGPDCDGVVLAVLVRGYGVVGIVDDLAQVGVVPPVVVRGRRARARRNAERAHGVPHADEPAKVLQPWWPSIPRALDCARASGARKSAKQSDIGAQAKQHLVYRIAGTSQ